MKKVKVKIPAKINRTLDVKGVSGGYHEINSLVCSVSVYDFITVKKRKDGLITLTERGKKSECETVNNNAYKAAVAFVNEFKTAGADIALYKNIPVGGGMGGSSADIAGTLIALKKLYNIKSDILPLANSLGSDSGYMLSGGAAIISGRGDKIKPLSPIPGLYLVIIPETKKCTSAESYNAFDKIGKNYACATEKAASAIEKSDKKEFFALLKNDLTEGSMKIIPEIKGNIKELKAAGAITALMTGSGSCTYGVFLNKKDRDKAYKKLRVNFGDRLIKAKTL